MESKTKKKVKSGDEFDHLFPRPSGKNITIKKDAGVEDTVSLIHQSVPLTLKDTEKVAPLLKGRTLRETCRNIWNFVYDHIPYKKDDRGIEQVRRPARVWWDRKKQIGDQNLGHKDDFEPGCDCDCMTEIVHSLLMNNKIKAKSRITIYNYDTGYQHIYVIVPKDQKLNYELDNRDNYIVIDCVKDAFDDEHPFLEYKDYAMRLDLLNGLEGNEEEIKIYDLPPLGDVHDLFGVYWNDDELGELGKIKLGKAIKKVVKKVGDAAGKAIRTVNKVANPATIALRNAFLLAMKLNIMNVPKRLRYAYLSDDQAKKLNMNLDALSKLRKIKDKAETIYWQAGGKKDNLKKAILSGKGNNDKKVQLSGLNGLNDYADDEEYNILHGELGAVAAILAPAMVVMKVIAELLKQIKGLFKPGSPEEANMASEQEDELPATITQQANSITNTLLPAMKKAAAVPNLVQDMTDTSEEDIMNFSESPAPVNTTARALTPVPAVPQTTVPTVSQPSAPATTTTATEEPQDKQTEQKGFLAWVTNNPWKTTAIGAGTLLLIGGGIFLATRNKSFDKTSHRTLNGLPKVKRKKKKKSSHRKVKLQEFKLR